MRKLKLICTVFLCFGFEANLIHSEEINKFGFGLTGTKLFGISEPQPIVLTSINAGIRIGCRGNELNVYPLDGHDRPCSVPANGMCPSEIYAVVLGNGNIVMKERDLIEHDHIINIANPVTCANKIVVVKETKNKDIQLIPYFDTFDIFHGGDEIYRYTDKGVLYDTINNIELNAVANFLTFFIFKPANSETTYFTYRPLRGGKSEINALNCTYGRTKTFHFDHRIDAFSSEHGRFGLCYASKEPNPKFNLQCKILDSRFRLQKFAKTAVIETDDVIKNMALHNTRDGGMIVVYTVPNYNNDTVNVYYSRIYPLGGIGDKNTLLGEKNGDHTDVHIREVDVKTNRYCIYVSSKHGFRGAKDLKVDIYCYGKLR